jgi:hypothetical protein
MLEPSPNFLTGSTGWTGYSYMKKNNPDNPVNPVKINEVSYKHRRWPRASSLIKKET